MNAWEYLGIEPTDDEKLVKRAYAKILKTIQPEIDRDAFISLRNAFEAAIAYIRNPVLVCSDVDEDDLEYDEQTKASTIDAKKIVTESHKTGRYVTKQDHAANYDDSDLNENVYQKAIDIFHETRKLLDDENGRGVEKNWHGILNHPELKNLEVKEAYVYLLFKHFSYMNHLSEFSLLPNIWMQINNFCYWRYDEVKLYKMYPEDMVDRVLHPIRLALKETTKLENKKIRKGFVLSREQRTRKVDNSEEGLDAETLEEKSKPWPGWVTFVIWMMVFGLVRRIFFG